MTMVADEAFATLLSSPRLSLYAQKIRDTLLQEAERRQAFYQQIAEYDKAEFINGEMIFHSPVKLKHNAVVKRLLVLLDTYVQQHGLGYIGFEKILISLTRNDYEPDLCFFGREKAEAFTPDQMQFPAPDLIVEVLSPSTAERDRGVKYDDYAAHGVWEYWIVDPDAETVEHYQLSGPEYDLVVKAKTGEIESAAITGLTLSVRAIFDDQANQAALRQFLLAE